MSPATTNGKLLAEAVDPGTGTVRHKAKVADADEMVPDTRSTETAPVRK